MTEQNFLKTTVSVGICAYNEEATIGSLLKGVLEQRRDNLFLKEVLVVSDGSTDNTLNIVQAINDERVVVIDGKERLGKVSRLNTIFTRVTGDLLILVDADVQLGNEYVFEKMVEKKDEDASAGLIGGAVKTRKGRNLIEEAINSSVEVYQRFAGAFKEGNNVYHCNGRLLALSKPFYQKASIPEGIIADDLYLYFLTLSLDFSFKFAPLAFVYYRSPSNLSDHVHQNRRYLYSNDQLKKVFGPLVDQQYKLPQFFFFWSVLIQFFKSPFLTLFIFVLNFYGRFLIPQKKIENKWETIATTKGGVVLDE